MRKLVLLATMAIAATSLGKGYIQEWTPKSPAWESVVYSCGRPGPVPYRLAAMDDFSFDYEVQISNINWWGVLSSKKQAFRPYYIAIYEQSIFGARCSLGNIVWSGCVTPYEAYPVGEDCQGREVWKINSIVPPIGFPISLKPGHYWLQVSEIDRDSYTPNVTDFWWSSHQETVGCVAMQQDPFGAITRPLIDPCNGKPDDLAFEIY